MDCYLEHCYFPIRSKSLTQTLWHINFRSNGGPSSNLVYTKLSTLSNAGFPNKSKLLKQPSNNLPILLHPQCQVLLSLLIYMPNLQWILCSKLPKKPLLTNKMLSNNTCSNSNKICNRTKRESLLLRFRSSWWRGRRLNILYSLGRFYTTI